jgi:hypothetical protein
MEVFSKAALKNFEDRMLVHLTELFPRPCGRLGEKNTREVILQGIAKAREHGIVSERDVCIYIDIMVEFGNDFDCDPALPWASQILKDPNIKGPTYRINCLYDVAMEKLKLGANVHGERS